MLQALMVDDEAEARGALRVLLAKHAPEVQLIAEAGSVADALPLIVRHKPQLLFLDVQMPGGDGFELLRRLGTWDFDVIFTTGSSTARHPGHPLQRVGLPGEARAGG
jgi:two-component system LytT family response regulator